MLDLAVQLAVVISNALVLIVEANQRTIRFPRRARSFELTQVNASRNESVALLDIAAHTLELGVSPEAAVNARGLVVATFHESV